MSGLKSRTILVIIAVMLISNISCSSNDVQSLNGEYHGIILTETTQTRNDNVQVYRDSFDVSLTLLSKKFEVGDCSGDVTTELDKMVFLSENCDCWCDCDPTVDCSGYPLLGEYALAVYPDSIVMNGEYDQTTIVGNIEHVWIVEKKVVLFR